MLKLRKLLTNRYDWYESCLQQFAEQDGHGNLSRPLIEFLAHIGREPVRLVAIASQMNVSRQWARRLANEAQELGWIDLEVDTFDKRAMIVKYSAHGWSVVKLAAARMKQIDTELERRIGAENVAELIRILDLDWGEPCIGDAEDNSPAFTSAIGAKKRALKSKSLDKGSEVTSK